jgi:hypothetical protein
MTDAVRDQFESLLKGAGADVSAQIKLAHNHGHRSLYMTLTLLQSMRLNNSFADFTVLGSQYENEDGIREWHLAVWSESYTRIRRYWISEDHKPEKLMGADLEAVYKAISKWEARPVWVRSSGSNPPQMRPQTRLASHAAFPRFSHTLFSPGPCSHVGSAMLPSEPQQF